MIKSLVVMALGAVATLEGERLLARLKGRMTPRAFTDGMIESANRRLERERSGPS